MKESLEDLLKMTVGCIGYFCIQIYIKSLFFFLMKYWTLFFFSSLHYPLSLFVPCLGTLVLLTSVIMKSCLCL